MSLWATSAEFHFSTGATMEPECLTFYERIGYIYKQLQSTHLLKHGKFAHLEYMINGGEYESKYV